MINVKEYYNRSTDLCLFIKVSEYCNINCSFCYQNAPSGTMIKSEDEFKRTFENIDLMFKKFDKVLKQPKFKNSILHICFFGGEPTTNIDGIKKICEYIKDKYYDTHNRTYCISITTNGTIYSEDIINAISDASSYNVTMQISADAVKCQSDNNRFFKNGNTSVYDVVQSNIPKYITLLNKVNGKDGLYVKISGVIPSSTKKGYVNKAASESEAAIMKSEYKGKVRSVLRNEYTHNAGIGDVVPDSILGYLEEHANLLYEKNSIKISELNDFNRKTIMSELIGEVLHFKNGICECTAVSTIDSNGNFNYCNKNKHIPGTEDTYDPEKMKEYILNLDYNDAGLYPCSKQKVVHGNLFKSAAVAKLYSEFISKYTHKYSLNSLLISPELRNDIIVTRINDWIYASTDKVTVNESARHIIDEYNALEKVTFTEDVDLNAFVVESSGKVYASSILHDIEVADITDVNFIFFNNNLIEDIKSLNTEITETLIKWRL
ncbi:MAG: radical SAM protein [Cetobacterium sp.]